MERNDYRVRKGTVGDAQRITELCIQLGYDPSVEEVRTRLKSVCEIPDQSIIVAEKDGNVVGWLQCAIRVAVESGWLAEILGLVVDRDVRQSGVGRLLVEEAENWALLKGQSTLRVRTNANRVESHLFYRSVGFTEIKKQAVFQKSLSKHA